MPITDPTAVKFSNEQVRVSANKLAQAYDGAKMLSAQWTALGAGQPALDALRPALRNLADFFTSTHDFVHKSGLLWQSHSAQAGVALIENTGETIIDGSPADGRQSITGVQANNIINRLQEFLNWGDLGAFTATANKGGGGAWLYTIMDVSNDQRDPVLAAAGLFLNRCDEIVTDYEASANAKLNTILDVATNPNYGTLE